MKELVANAKGGRPKCRSSMNATQTQMTVTLQPRKINNMVHDVPTVDGMDRVQINNRLHYISVEMDKLKQTQMALLQMRDAIDYECDRREAKDAGDNLFDEMFGEM